MALVRIHDLQGRSADQPVIHRQGDPGNRHFIPYVGHHGRTETMPGSPQLLDRGPRERPLLADTGSDRISLPLGPGPGTSLFGRPLAALAPEIDQEPRPVSAHDLDPARRHGQKPLVRAIVAV